MADKTLKTRIILNNKLAKDWETVKDNFKPMKGEFVVETDTRKIKIGDGVTTYGDLPYATLTPGEVQTLITNASHSHNNKSVLDATTASFTTELKSKLDGIATGANKTIVDSALSADSTNPVQNKVINSALSGKVPTTRTINKKALSADISLTASDVGAASASHTHDERYYTESEVDTKLSTKAASSHKHVAGDITSVNASAINGVIASANLPSFVDDVLEGYLSSDGKFYKSYDSTNKVYSNAYTGETGKIYVDLSNNKTYRWSGSAYTVISETIALGETSSTAYRGDYGAKAYAHAVTNKGSKFDSGFYKITTNAEGHVTSATAVTKADITGLGIPGSDTKYTASDGIKLDGTTFKHTNAVTAGTVSGSSGAIGFGGSITIPSVTYDAQGHITDKSSTRVTLPSKPGDVAKLTTARAIDGVNFDGSSAITHYGVCSTAAATAAKTVALTGFTLTVGARITIKFTVTNTVASPTLNVNGTGAKPIYYRGSAIYAGLLAANRTYEFVYDGTSYNLVGDINTDSNTDTKVTQTAVKDSDYTNWRPLVWGSSNSGTEGFSPETVTDSVFTGTSFSVQPSTGTLKATTFKGNLSGKATSADKATNADYATSAGSATSATKAGQLTTARNLSITGGATATAKSFNGTANVALEVTSLDATKLSLNAGDTLILDGSI